MTRMMAPGPQMTQMTQMTPEPQTCHERIRGSPKGETRMSRVMTQMTLISVDPQMTLSLGPQTDCEMPSAAR